MRISPALRDALADLFATTVDAGASDSVIELRTGPPPSSVTDAAAGTLLAVISLPAPVFSAASSGTIAANAIATATGIADGDVGHFRVLDGDANIVEDSGSVGTSSAELVVNTLSITDGGAVDINSWTVTMPAE